MTAPAVRTGFVDQIENFVDLAVQIDFVGRTVLVDPIEHLVDLVDLADLADLAVQTENLGHRAELPLGASAHLEPAVAELPLAVSARLGLVAAEQLLADPAAVGLAPAAPVVLANFEHPWIPLLRLAGSPQGPVDPAEGWLR